ncbi:hypothetical protein YC2023_111800 [Brassica napus]
MAQSSTPTLPRVIVDPRYCVPDPVYLAMVRDNINFKYGNYDIRDVNGNMLFQVKKPGFGYFSGRKMFLLDGSGSPVLTMKEKTMTMHGRWKVYRGGSTEECDLLYSVKSSTMQVLLTTELKVFLGHNHEEQICDFIVRLMKDERSCAVYAGESDDDDNMITYVDHVFVNCRTINFTIATFIKPKLIAQENTPIGVLGWLVTKSNGMKHKKRSSGLDNFLVTVNPNVDYAFIASLVVLFDVFNRMDPPTLMS